MITKEQVLAAQDAWGNGIVAIGKGTQDAREFVNKMYVTGALLSQQWLGSNHSELKKTMLYPIL